MATGLLKLGVKMGGATLVLSGAASKPAGYTPKVIFVTDTGAYLTEDDSFYSQSEIMGLVLYYNGTSETIYNPETDSIPLSVTLPEDLGYITELDTAAVDYAYVERVVNEFIFAHTEDFSLVDITELKRIRVTRSGSDSNTVKVGTVNCPTVAEFFIISDTEFFCDIKLTGSIKYTPGGGLMDSAEITIPIIPGRLEAGESITARNISIVAREDGAAFNYILIPYDVRYADGEVSFYVKGYKPNDTISGTAKTVATYINVHIAGLFIPAS